MLFIAALFMSDNISTNAADQEIRLAVEHIQRSEERVRRPERWPEADQPEAAASEKRKASQRWQVYGLVSQPAGGKNQGRKQMKLGPYMAPTKEAAEAARDKDIDEWLHAPTRAIKKAKTHFDSEAACSGQREKRKAAPIDLGESNATRGPKQGKGKAGSGCVATACLCLGDGREHAARALCTAAYPHARAVRSAPQARARQRGAAATDHHRGLAFAASQRDRQLAATGCNKEALADGEPQAA